MPFQSEKQRRYLWANEPEIARDWTDTYGSGIAKALGGRINYLYGGITHPDGRRGFPGGSGRDDDTPMPTGGSGANYGGPPGGGATSQGSGRDVYTAPINRHTGPTTKEALRIGALKKSVRDFEKEKDYTPMGQIKPGPQLGLARSGAGGGLGSMASQFIGSKIGGGLGSMLFGPWGGLLLSMFGRGVGKRGWQARQTKEKESLRDILLGENTILSSMFNKKKTPTPTDEGLGGIENKFADDYNYRPSEKMYWDEQQTSMPKNLGASISELENWMSENPQLVQQKHINYAQALQTAQHNKALEEDPNRPGLRLSQLWE